MSIIKHATIKTLVRVTVIYNIYINYQTPFRAGLNKWGYNSLPTYAFKLCIGTTVPSPIGTEEWLGRKSDKNVGMKLIVKLLVTNFIFLVLLHFFSV